MSEDIDRLRKERDELAARCEQIEEEMNLIRQIAAHPPKDKTILRISEKCLSETKAASLAHVRAEAVESLRFPGPVRNWTGRQVQEWIESQAQSIRQNARQLGGENDN